MKNTLLLSVDYSGNENYWQDSNIKNKIVQINADENIHDQISQIIKENDFVELSYKNKPQSNVFVDVSNESKRVGYVYRGKSEIYNDNTCKWVKANFDVWVTIKQVSDYVIEEIEL